MPLAAGAPLWATQLVVAMALNGVTQAIQIGAYAARYAGVRTGRIATSISLFNLFVTASRLAALFLTPSLGALADNATRPALVAKLPAVQPEVVHAFDLQMRLIVAAGTLGTILGAILLPTFIYLFTRGIRSFERRNSVFQAVVRLGDPRVMMDVLSSIRLPEIPTILAYTREAVPLKLLIGNLVVMAIYAIGVPAAYYASVLNLDARTTAAGLSGIVNGIGTLAFTFFVDPTSALMVDQAVKEERSLDSIRAMVIGLTLTAIAGTVVSQLLLWPGAFLDFARRFVLRPWFRRSPLMVRVARAVLLAVLLVAQTGCARGVESWIVRTRDNQGDRALRNGNIQEAALAYRLALQVNPLDRHTRAAAPSRSNSRSPRSRSAMASSKTPSLRSPLPPRSIRRIPTSPTCINSSTKLVSSARSSCRTIRPTRPRATRASGPSSSSGSSTRRSSILSSALPTRTIPPISLAPSTAPTTLLPKSSRTGLV